MTTSWEQGVSQHRNGQATGGRVTGVAAADLRLGGPGFTVEVLPADDADGVVLGVQGAASPEQVLRLCGRHGLLEGDEGRVVARIDTTAGHDRYVYTADMTHRLLFSRTWGRDGRVGVMYGLNPIVGDTQGDPDRTPNRKTLSNAVGMLSHGGRLARIDVLNVFTRRTADAAGLPKDLSSRVADPQLERAVLEEADVVLLAWGADGAAHPSAIAGLATLLDELGIVPKVPSKAGELMVSGDPPQPMHPRGTGYRSVRLVDAPDDWHTGLPSGPTGLQVRTASAADLARFDVEEEQGSRDGGKTEVAWHTRKPRSLFAELTTAGLSEAEATSVSSTIREWASRPELTDTIAALKRLLRGEVPVLVDGGETELALWEALPRLLRATRDPVEIAQSLAVGAICSGAVGEYASFLECTRPGADARHKDRQPNWPVPGLSTPSDARLAYARLAGYSGTDDSRGTEVRGDGRRMQAASYPQPAERYGWASR